MPGAKGPWKAKTYHLDMRCQQIWYPQIQCVSSVCAFEANATSPKTQPGWAKNPIGFKDPVSLPLVATVQVESRYPLTHHSAVSPTAWNLVPSHPCDHNGGQTICVVPLVNLRLVKCKTRDCNRIMEPVGYVTVGTAGISINRVMLRLLQRVW